MGTGSRCIGGEREGTLGRLVRLSFFMAVPPELSHRWRRGANSGQIREEPSSMGAARVRSQVAGNVAGWRHEAGLCPAWGQGRGQAGGVQMRTWTIIAPRAFTVTVLARWSWGTNGWGDQGTDYELWLNRNNLVVYGIIYFISFNSHNKPVCF